MGDISASVKWLPNSRFRQGDRILMRDGTIWVCVAPGISCSKWREEAFQIPDGSIVDGSVIWRTAERVKEDQAKEIEEESAPAPESSNSAEGLEDIIQGALAEALVSNDTSDAYVVLIEGETSENDE